MHAPHALSAHQLFFRTEIWFKIIFKHPDWKKEINPGYANLHNILTVSGEVMIRLSMLFPLIT